jgi:prolyl oligopeptidase
MDIETNTQVEVSTVTLNCFMTKPNYPNSSIQPVTDNLHGVEITDNYRWLEDGNSAQTKAWVTEQNAFSRAYLEQCPEREALAAELKQNFAQTLMWTPNRYGNRYFFMRREAGQNQAVLYFKDDSLEHPEHLALDPNTFSSDGTTALDFYHPSPDGKLLAYGFSSGGREIGVLKVKDLETGDDLDLEISPVRYPGVSWLADSSGFYYERMPKVGSVPPADEMYHRALYFHALGTNPDSDVLVFKPDNKVAWCSPYSSSDKSMLFVAVTEAAGGEKNDLYIMPLEPYRQGLEPKALAVGLNAKFSADVVDGVLYVMTNHDAPRFKLMRGNLEQPGFQNWTEIIAESEHVLGSFELVGGKITVLRSVDATSRLYIHNLDGVLERAIALPGLGSIVGWSGRYDSSELFYAFQSFTVPQTIFSHDLNTLESRIIFQAESALDLSLFETRQEFFTSKDGTRVPMFIVCKKNLERDGNNPTVLYGYGGFNVSQSPSYSGAVFSWLSRGGVYVVANIRGGSEYGEDWHRAGMLERKQNVFDDFIAAAEYLIASSVTKPARLACYGGSNGGLLTGAVLVQRPELFGAVIIGVPLLDMLRYQHFLIAKLWIPEYGDPDKLEDFEWLRAYSPYHNVKSGVAYPPTLILTGESDSRVDPLHARKMAALLQEKTVGDGQILLRVEEKAGHGQGKPISKIIAEGVDRYSFLLGTIGVED